MIMVCLGGCSIAIVGPDTTRAVRTAPHCETSKTLVKLDGAMATGLAIVGGALTGSNAGSAGGVLLVSGALYAAAALRGNNVVDHCRAAFDDYEKEVAAGPPVDRGPPIKPVGLRSTVTPTGVAAAPADRHRAPTADADGDRAPAADAGGDRAATADADGNREATADADGNRATAADNTSTPTTGVAPPPTTGPRPTAAPTTTRPLATARRPTSQPAEPNNNTFHKAVGEQPAPKRAPTQISEPTTAPWRDFWREVP